MWSRLWKGERQFIRIVTWPRWPPCPYMVKTFKNLLLWNRWTDLHITSYVASRTQTHHSLCNWWSLVVPDLIYTIGKSENSGFFRKYSSLWSESLFMQLTNWVNEDKRVWRSKSFLDLGPRSFTYENRNLLFSGTTGPFCTKLCI